MQCAETNALATSCRPEILSHRERRPRDMSTHRSRSNGPSCGLMVPFSSEVTITQATVQGVEALPGLCSTCNHAADCVKRLTNDMVIWYCEEFDNYVAPQPPQYPARPAQSAPSDPVSERLVGLCVNCERRGYCVHAKRVGGVWHCEEYL